MKKIIFFIATTFVFSSVPQGLTAEVYVRGERGRWHLEVNGQPFYIQGVGCGIAQGRQGEDYLKMAKGLGANTVRTWGTDQGTAAYLDLAERYGLKVACGIWLNHVDQEGHCSYLFDQEYKKAKEKETLDYIKKFKDHPAVLAWVLGNEAIFFTKNEDERVALCQFLENLIQKIHELDGKHPVVYASAGITDLPYLAKHVSSLDLIGVNEYGSIRMVHGTWDHLGFNKPYVFTEYGPYLSLDRPKDEHGMSLELSDENKAMRYKDFTQQIHSFKGFNVGGFAFHLGETTQESMTWWNINFGDAKKRSFWILRELYTGESAPDLLPKIKRFVLRKVSHLKPKEWIEVSLEPDDSGLRNDLIFEYKISTAQENILKYYVNEFIPADVLGSGRHVRLRLPSKKGVYRIYGFIRDRQGNITSRNRTISID